MRIGLGTSAFAGAAAVVLSAGVASAATMTIPSLPQDFEPRVSLVNGSYAPGPSTTAASVRVGVSGANSNRTYTNSLFFLPLPALRPGEIVSAASFGFTNLPETSTSAVAPMANADLYALGFVNENPPLNGEAQSTAYFFNGPLDTGAGVGGPAVGRQLIQDNLLVPADSAVGSAGARETNAAGDAALLNYIRGLYAARPINGMVPGTSSLLLRLNYDTDAVFDAATVANRYTIISADAAADRPTLTLETTLIPEPGAAGLGLGAAVMMLGRRRRA